MSLVDLGKRLLEAARKGQDDEVRSLMANGAPFTTDWVSCICCSSILQMQTNCLLSAIYNLHFTITVMMMVICFSWEPRHFI